MCHSAPIYPIITATIAAMILPSITAIMVCHTESEDATRAAPSCQLVRLNCQTDHHPTKVKVDQVRREGGKGRISSFIHTETASLFSEESVTARWRRRNMVPWDVAFIMLEAREGRKKMHCRDFEKPIARPKIRRVAQKNTPFRKRKGIESINKARNKRGEVRCEAHTPLLLRCPKILAGDSTATKTIRSPITIIDSPNAMLVTKEDPLVNIVFLEILWNIHRSQ